jgi:predicted ATP-grasp superfamily ATP-dependent carboligase
VNGLGLVRALAARDVPTAVVTTKPYDIAHRSRWVAAHEAVFEIEERPERLVELLERRAPAWRGWVLLPTNDGALAALAQHRDRLAALYRVAAPPWEVARTFIDKARLLEVARAAGVDRPHCYGPAVAATADLPRLRYPVVVKPSEGHRFFTRFGTKLFTAADRATLVRAIARLTEAGMAGQVYDLVPGADDHIYAYCTYVDARGEPTPGVTVRKLRQSPSGFGVARVAEVVAELPALREATVEILRRAGLRGVAVAEFKLDPRDGRYRFLEVNARPVVYNGLLRRAGLDLGALTWSEHVHGRPEPPRPERWPGVWIHLHADVLYAAFDRRHERLGAREFVAPYRRPRIWAVWSARDPMPFLLQWSRTLAEGVTALRRGTYRRLLADRTHAPDAP